MNCWSGTFPCCFAYRVPSNRAVYIIPLFPQLRTVPMCRLFRAIFAFFPCIFFFSHWLRVPTALVLFQFGFPLCQVLVWSKETNFQELSLSQGEAHFSLFFPLFHPVRLSISFSFLSALNVPFVFLPPPFGDLFVRVGPARFPCLFPDERACRAQNFGFPAGLVSFGPSAYFLRVFLSPFKILLLRSSLLRL